MKTIFSDSTRSRFPQTHWILLQRLAAIVNWLEESLTGAANFPETKDPREFLNAYIDFGLAVFSAELLQLYEGVAHAVENENYLVYAQCGRAILENIAALRYYSSHVDLVNASDAWKSSTLTDPVLRKANETFDRFVRGNRFSWEAFTEGHMDKLTRIPHQEHLAQINSTTCLQKWFKKSPKVESLYDLFCDLVHPNLGSNLLVLGTHGKGLVAGAVGAQSMAIFVVAPTLAGLIGGSKEVGLAFAALSSQKLLIPNDVSFFH